MSVMIKELSIYDEMATTILVKSGEVIKDIEVKCPLEKLHGPTSKVKGSLRVKGIELKNMAYNATVIQMDVLHGPTVPGANKL